MQRTIEALAGDRRRLEERFQQQVEILRAAARSLAGLHDRLAGGGKSDRIEAAAESLRLTSGLAESAAALAETSSALSEARDKEWDALGNNHLGLLVQGLETRITRLAEASEDAASLGRTFVLLQDQLGRLLAVLREKRLPTPAQVEEVWEPIRDWRYARFENRHRGPQAEIRAQLERYLPYLPSAGTILDLGCGRGEFLELLREHGFRGRGVDLNAQLVDDCRSRGLEVEKADLLEALAAREDGSLQGVFSAQVIEHLPAASLERLVELSHAKLASGGVLILETINPASVYALVHAFYTDLTHRLPVHPEALRFLADAVGFAGTEIVYSGLIEPERLHPLPAADGAARILNQNVDKLNRLLFASPNYAAVARKA